MIIRTLLGSGKLQSSRHRDPAQQAVQVQGQQPPSSRPSTNWCLSRLKAGPPRHYRMFAIDWRIDRRVATRNLSASR